VHDRPRQVKVTRMAQNGLRCGAVTDVPLQGHRPAAPHLPVRSCASTFCANGRGGRPRPVRALRPRSAASAAVVGMLGLERLATLVDEEDNDAQGGKRIGPPPTQRRVQ
jgi:hypothetical protein